MAEMVTEVGSVELKLGGRDRSSNWSAGTALEACCRWCAGAVVGAAIVVACWLLELVGLVYE
jgi:hypothetical protein